MKIKKKLESLKNEICKGDFKIVAKWGGYYESVRVVDKNGRVSDSMIYV